ncbi:TonB-dependent receptor [Azorhizobium oxalatiphilum]|uniref:TonB-dependent receptor n=1 Tax=Azorhizobium oxalatiphilum TaxID=980631 RepID=UPI00166EA31C|nr:TonB-dependent receptor [Azorhizobium oxalatiphilum]
MAAAVQGRSCLHLHLLCGVAVILSMGAGSARAQQLAEDGSILLDVVSVEARRYGEDALSVPISLSVVSGAQLESERVSVMEDLSDRVPNLLIPNYGDDPRTAQPIIRGIGTLSTMLSPDNSTAPTIIDGVPMPAFAANAQLLDIGQVEVLRGPQGTLFGRNSTGGAINVISVLPDGKPGGMLITEVGTDSALKGEMSFGGAITDTLYSRFSARYQRRGAYVTNDHPGADDIGAMDVGAFKSSWRWLPSLGTEIRVTAGYEKYNGDTGYPYLLRDNNAYQQTPVFERDLMYLTVNGSHDFEHFTLKTVTGVTYYDIYNWTDNSDGYVNSATFGAYGMPVPVSAYTFDGDYNVTGQRETQLYQEVRLQSLENALTKWVLGGVISYNDFTENVYGSSSMSASINGTRDVNLKGTSAALFFDVAQPFAERFEIGFGMRYTHDRKSIDATYLSNGFPGTVAAYAQDAARNFDLLSGRLSLSYKLTDDSLIYASLNRGTKAGGYPRFTGNAAIGEPEQGYDATTVWAYELGTKARIRETGTSFSAALFYNDVSDEAIFGYDALTASFPIENFDLKTYGVEGEVQQELAHGFGLSAGFALTHAEITGVPLNSVLPATVGNEVPNVPLWSGNIRLTYQGQTGFMGFDAARLNGYLAYRYVGERAGDTANTFDLDPQHIIDARLGVKTGRMEVYAYGENLVGELLEQQGANMTGSINSVLVSRGRVLGLGVATTF